ncbi:MAG: YfcC family protein [Bacteroidales bacterium]|nr:YfcC family protein [Bacteroidales bacterium]
MMFKKLPHTYVIIFSLIIIAAIATFIIPSGEFLRVETTTDSGKVVNQIVPGTFHYVESSNQTWQIMSAFFKGFQKAPGIIAFILILGGAFWILNETGAINMGVQTFLRKSTVLEKYSFFRKIGVNNLVVILIMIMFSLFGAIFGMSEETIAFVAIFVPLAISMGYDSITGVCMCFLAAGLGFAGCILNPFTLGIAQDIAGIKMFSGIEYRLVIWFIMTLLGIVFVLMYANKVKKNPKRSIMYEEDNYWRKQQDSTELASAITSTRLTYISFFLISIIQIIFSIVLCLNGVETKDIIVIIAALLYLPFAYFMLRKSMQMFSLSILIYTIIYLVIGVTAFDWDFSQITALFFSMAIFSGMALGKTFSQIAQLFIAGAKDILSAALVVGLASRIIVILEDGKIIDTLLFYVSNSIQGTGKGGAITIMYSFQTLLNAIITSGTAKAAMLMPMFREISNMVGLSLQSTVTAFHIGDGLTNLLTPTSGVLIAVLGIARIPYVKWVQFAWKFILVMVVVGWLLLLPTLFLSLPNF